MSLTSHLSTPRSPLGAWFRETFAATSAVVRFINATLADSPGVPPPAGALAGTLGTAIDYRIRFAFDRPVVASLIAVRGARRSMDYVDPHLAVAFFESLGRLLADASPGLRPRDDETERTLARHCVVLALLDEAFRAGGLDGGDLVFAGIVEPRFHSRLMDLPSRSWVADLLALVTEDEIADVCAVIDVLRSHGEPLATRAAARVITNPSFSTSERVGGADADLILGGCLLDIKSNARGRVTGRHVLQLAGYALLDVNDTYRIDELGFYLARHGAFLSFPAALLLAALAGDVPPFAILDGRAYDV